MSEPKQQWASRLGVILAVAGSAVGLGNFLRFPGNAAQNGGGAFMIPYFCALLLLGIPIGWAEWTMGRYGGRKGFHSAPAIMGLFMKGGLGRYLGVIGVLIPVAVYFYYIVIEAWCLQYFWVYLTEGDGVLGAIATVPDQVKASSAAFDNVTGNSADGSLFSSNNFKPIVFWVITFAVNFYFVYRGLSKGIEAFCKWAMPAMGVCALIVLARVLTLGTPDPNAEDRSVSAGLNFMWNPDFDKLWDPKVWLASAGQIFFSLSVGFGVIINYASYMRRKDDVVLSGLTASATNEFFEVALGGLITLTAAVAFMGVDLTKANTGGTFSTGFTALPVVFAHMPGGRFFGAIWFFMLFLAAITSSLSMLQPAKAFFEEALGWTKQRATLVLGILAVAGNVFVLYYSKDLLALDTIDFWVGSFLIFIMGAVQIISFGWIFGLERGWKEMHEGAHIRVPTFYKVIIKYVAPAYLIVIFVLFCIEKIPPYWTTLTKDTQEARTAILSWTVILSTLGLLLVVAGIGARRWRAQGLDLDGTKPPADEKE